MPRRTVALLLVSICVLVLLVQLGLWYARTGSLTIETDATAGTKVSIKLVNDSGIQTIQATTPLEGLKVHRGNYDIYIQTDGGGFFSTAKVGGFLKTSFISGTIQSEYGREFLAKDLGSCILQDNDTIYSYGCSGSVKDVRRHQPGSTTLPSVAERGTATNAVGNIGGIVEIGNDRYALVSSPATTQTYASQRIYKLDLNNSHGEFVGDLPVHVLEELDPFSVYSLRKYSDKLMIFNNTFTEVLELSPTNFSSMNILSDLDLLLPSNNTMRFMSEDITDEAIVILYSLADFNQTDSGSELIIRNSSRTNRYQFNKNYTSVKKCGDYYCLIDERGMDIVNLNEPARYTSIGRIQSVKDVYYHDGQIIVISDTGIISYDAASNTGNILYSFGEYSYRSITPTPSGFLIGIQYGGGGISGLHLSRSLHDKDIDKKILILLNSEHVGSISAYKNNVYISPGIDTGMQTYDIESEQFVITEESKLRLAQQIRELITSSGIDTEKYNIINTLF